MATANYGGQWGGRYVLHLDVWETNVDTNSNSSVVNAHLYMQTVQDSGYFSNSGNTANIVIDGQQFNFGGTYGTGNGNHELGTASKLIYHNADGTRAVGVSGFHNADNSPGLTSASTGTTIGLTTINRYLNINSWGINSITEQSMNVYVNTSDVSNAVDYTINGSGWINGYTGNFTGTTFTIPNLIQNQTYSIQIRVRNASGGLYTTSGVQAATTREVYISNYSLTGQSDTSLSMNVSTNYVADALDYQINNSGTWINIYSGDFTSVNRTITGLTSNTSYTVTVRARHKKSQTYTSQVTKTATTSYPTPLQSINLVPSNGGAVSTTSPTLSWTFTSTSPDAQSAYEIIIYNQATGSQVWDSGKITSTLSSAVVPTSLLSFDVNYQWKVKTWSSANVQGPYTGLALFKISHAPVTTITSPTNLTDFQNDTPTFTWTYSDAENTPQSAYRITIQSITTTGSTTGTTIYTTLQQSNATSFTLSPAILDNGTRYIVKITTIDSDGIESAEARREFTVTFVGPPTPNIHVQLSEDELFNRISATANTPANDSYETDEVYIYKRERGEADWNQIGIIGATSKYIEDYETTTGWTATPGTASVQTNTNAKKNDFSLSLINSTFGTSTYTHASTIGTLDGYDKVRVWVRTTDISIVGSLEFRFGNNSTNYYSFTVYQTDLQPNVWNSIEVEFDALTVTGTPTLSNIVWDAVVLVSHTPSIPNETYSAKYGTGQYANNNGTATATLSNATNVGNGVILVDGLRAISSSDQSFIYDYNIANNKTYEYAAAAVSTEENLSSAKIISQDVITVKYTDYLNTYIVPIGDETNSVIGFMEGSMKPHWTSKSDIQYYLPVGLRAPIVYSLDKQKYVTGSIDILFMDTKLNCKALDSVHNLEKIMNNKPILLRTWWGDNYYVSIDGQLSISKDGPLGWTVSFDFTEISYDTQ